MWQGASLTQPLDGDTSVDECRFGVFFFQPGSIILHGDSVKRWGKRNTLDAVKTMHPSERVQIAIFHFADKRVVKLNLGHLEKVYHASVLF